MNTTKKVDQNAIILKIESNWCGHINIKKVRRVVEAGKMGQRKKGNQKERRIIEELDNKREDTMTEMTSLAKDEKTWK